MKTLATICGADLARALVPSLVALFVVGKVRILAQGDGMRGPSSAVQGGAIEVDVATNDVSVQVSTGGAQTTSYPVPPGRRVTIPVPPVPPGTIVVLRVGRGLRARILLVEIVAP